MALVFLEFTDVLLTVGPNQMPLTVHFVIQPIAGVLLLVAPDVNSGALDFVHLEFSLVDGSISKGELALAVLLAFEVCAFVHCTIWPGLEAKSVLLVVSPLTDIFGSICVSIGAISVRLVIEPVTFIDIAVSVVQLPIAVGLSISPLTLIA